jgi:hypothetical protein
VRGLAVVLALGALAAFPAFAAAQTSPAPGGSPFQPIPPAQPAPAPAPEPETPQPQQPTSLEEEDPSTLGVFGLFAVGVLVIVLIAFFIMRDARKSLPKRKRPNKRKVEPGGPAAATGSRRPPPPRSRKGSSSRTRRKQRRARRRAR